MSKPKLLFLAHRIPYPPNKGEKLRAYHLIRGLARDYDVYLGAPVDDADDWQHRDALNGLCAETCIVDGRGRSRQKAAVQAIAKREPVSFNYFRHRELMDWVKAKTTAHAFDVVFLYSSGTAPYLGAIVQPPARLIVDFVDVDSEKWRVLGQTTGGVMGRVYAREASLLRDEERALAMRADASLLVTDSETALFTQVTGISDGVRAVGNGVELAQWDKARSLSSPYARDDRKRLIFTGAMDYAPNVEAVSWFAAEVMPKLRARGWPVDFIIAGSNPTKAVQALARNDVTVTGRVKDMRPWLAHADLAVAPLQLARGVQNKVLEAMAAGVAPVVTQAALEGISAVDQESVIVAKDGAGFASAIAALLNDPARTASVGAAAREVIAARYSWDARFAELAAVIEGVRRREAA